MTLKSVQRFSLATNASRVCAEIMREITSMIPKIMRQPKKA
jgi:hypothetical protein